MKLNRREFKYEEYLSMEDLTQYIGLSKSA